jgi:hypothetical protein
VSGGYVRVSVVHRARRRDVALPCGVPLAELLPRLVDLCAPETDHPEPVRWWLARVGDAPFTDRSTVDGSGVVDGDVLLLDEGPAPDGPVAVDDVRDAVEDEVDQAGRFWHPAAALDLAAGVSAVAAAAAAGLVLWWGVTGTATVAGGGLLVVAGMAGGWWSLRAGRPGCAHLLVCVASGWGGLLAGPAGPPRTPSATGPRRPVAPRGPSP